MCCSQAELSNPCLICVYNKLTMWGMCAGWTNVDEDQSLPPFPLTTTLVLELLLFVWYLEVYGIDYRTMKRK